MRKWSLLLLLGASCCVGWASWVEDKQLEQQTSSRLPGGFTPRLWVLDLDKDPEDRWAAMATDPLFANYKKDLTSYIAEFGIPKQAVPLLADAAYLLRKSYYQDYLNEMIGMARALDMTVGEIVLVNLIYQLEDIGVNCTMGNVTGPCPPKGDVNSPGLCTGVVVNGQEVWQGRNLDWSLDPRLRKYIMRVDYQRGGKTVFSGVQIAGEVGVLHGIRPGGFSVQVNARATGGNVFENVLQLLIKGAKTPSHAMRKAFENEADFVKAEKFLSTERLANPVYFTMAGAEPWQGAVLSRDRNDLVDAWHLNETSSKDTKHINPQPDWLRLQTNYDHWKPAPTWDNRRDPGVANTKMACNVTVGQHCVKKVMTTWPTFNHHTDITSVMCPKTGYFDVTVWSHAADALVV